MFEANPSFLSRMNIFIPLRSAILDKPDLPARFDGKDVEVIRSDIAYQGFFTLLTMRLKHRLFGGGWSDEITRELLDRGDGSAAVLYDPENDLIGLVEQFRIGALKAEESPWCLEVVAGMIKEGETPEEVVEREILEETGLSDVQLLPITSYYSSPGGCTELIHLFCGLCDLSHAGGVHGLLSEHEDILLRVFSATTVFPVMLRGRANNSATLIGLQWLSENRSRLRKQQVEPSTT